MAFTHKNDKPKEECKKGSDEIRMDRVMSAPPQHGTAECQEQPENCVGVAHGQVVAEKALDEIKGRYCLDEIFNDTIECESEEEGSISEFDRFMMLEKLTRDFPPIDSSTVKSRILAACRMSARTQVPIEFYFAKGGEESYLEKIKNLKSKENTSFEKIRTEFNRVTRQNMGSVVQNLLEIQVETVSEMKEVAAFVFEKIVTEKVFFDVYLNIIQQLHKKWRCTEEKSMSMNQTCFFGTLLGLGNALLTGPQDWFAQVSEASCTGAQENVEDQIEEKYSIKQRKKQQVLGAAGFYAALYIENIVGPSGVLGMINKLVACNAPENIVIVCHVFKPLVMKFSSIPTRSGEVKLIADYLRSNLSCGDVRLQVEIERALDSVPELSKLIKSASVSSERKNTFSSLVMEEAAAPEPKSDEEVLQEYIAYVVSTLEALTDEEDISSFGQRIFKDMDTYGNKEFLSAYIRESVLNSSQFIKMKDLLLSKLLPKAVRLVDALQEVRNEIVSILGMDFPHTKRLFSELLCYLRASDALGEEDFVALRSNEYIKQAGKLLHEWKERKDNRLARVVCEEDMENVL